MLVSPSLSSSAEPGAAAPKGGRAALGLAGLGAGGGGDGPVRDGGARAGEGPAEVLGLRAALREEPGGAHPVRGRAAQGDPPE